MKLKTFDDIEFVLDKFDASNGGRYVSKTDLGARGILSVVYGGTGTYSDVVKIDGEWIPESYEAALLFGMDFVPLTPYDDVIGWRTAEEITELMEEIQTNPNFIKEKMDDKIEYRKDLDLE